MKLKNITKYNPLFVILIFSLTIRLVYALVSYQNTGIDRFDDDWDYVSYAKAILDQGIWLTDISKIPGDASIITPGFPLILASIFYVFGEKYSAVFIVNSIISTITVFAIYGLGKIIFNFRVGLLSSAWASLYILFIYYIPTCLKEIWLLFFITISVYFITIDINVNKLTWRTGVSAFVFSLLIHIDERFFVFFPLFIGLFLITENGTLMKKFQKAMFFAMVVLLLMIPWLIRNYNVYKRIIILSERTSIFTDELFGYEKNSQLLSYMGVTYDLDLFQSYSDSIGAGFSVNNVPSGLNHETLIKGISLGYIPHKFSKAERRWADFKEYWRPVRFSGGYINHGFRFQGPSWSWYGNLTRGLTYGILLPFFLVGICLIIKNNNRLGLFLLSLILVHMFIHIEFYHVVNRYRIQIDPLIILISFYAIDYLLIKFIPNFYKPKIYFN